MDGYINIPLQDKANEECVRLGRNPLSKNFSLHFQNIHSSALKHLVLLIIGDRMPALMVYVLIRTSTLTCIQIFHDFFL